MIANASNGARWVGTLLLIATALLGLQACESEPKGEPIRHLDKKAMAEPIPVSLTAGATANDPVLGQGDEVEITVFRQEDLARTIVIPPSEVIEFPMVGEINVRGMTARQLRARITEGLASFVKDPQVSVRTLVDRNQGFMVLGEVRQPGEYASPAVTTALQAIVRAGGFTDDARRQVVLIRPSGDRANAYVLDLGRALSHGDLRANVALAAGDVVYVPPSAAAKADRFAAHLSQWLSPILGVESAVILGDEIGERLEGDNGDSGVVIGPSGN